MFIPVYSKFCETNIIDIFVIDIIYNESIKKISFETKILNIEQKYCTFEDTLNKIEVSGKLLWEMRNEICIFLPKL